jgi:hypothetical protein
MSSHSQQTTTSSNNNFTMMLLYQISAYLQSLEELLFGLPLFLAPDYFFNPDDGLLVLRPFHHTSLASDHLDVATQISLAGAGASMLTFFFTRLLLVETKSEKILFSRMKLVNDLLLLPVIVHSAFFDKSGIFDQQTFTMLADFKLLCIALNLGSHRRHLDGQRTTNGYSMAARLVLLYCLPVGILLYALPGFFAPGKSLASYYTKTPLEQNTFDALEKFAIRFEGSQIVGFLPLYWEATKMTNFAYKTGVIFMVLYLFVFMRGILDRSGYCDLEVWKGNFVLHLVVLSLSWNLSRTSMETFALFKSYPPVDDTDDKLLQEDTLPKLRKESVHEKTD